jgi:putative transposase
MSRHSNDLRIRVVDFVKDGGSKLKASKLFKVARQTVFNWCKLDTENQLYRIIPRKPNCKLDTDKVINYVNQNPDKYNFEIAKEFNCSTESIRQFLKRHKFSVKKNKRYSVNRMILKEKNLLKTEIN